MIHVDLPARMECVAPKCGAALGVKLALTAAGTLVPRLPTGHGWQIALTEESVLVCRCPDHRVLIEQAPSGLVGAEH